MTALEKTNTTRNEAIPFPAEPSATILIVDDVSANVGALMGALESEGYRVLAALSGRTALKFATKANPDLILLDVLMPEMDGIETCRRLKASPQTRSIPVIFVTANDETTSLVDGFQAGGVDYITKPFQIDEILARVDTHLRIARLTRELENTNSELRQEIERREQAEEALSRADAKLSVLSEAEARQWGLAGFIGQSTSFRALLKDIRSIQNFGKANTLLTGESGTGKELIARAIHYGGSRTEGAFVPVNCSALPADLAESQLFGHVRGAFTGAVADHKGYFTQADGGTLFLDEIGDMPLTLQAKLLRVLEDGEVYPVGGTRGHQVSVRVVAATNVDLPAKVAEGKFRQDLYYRLMHFHVQVPPLRERREDIPLLAEHFIQRVAADLKIKSPQLRADVCERLLAHNYPGNIRELKNTIERALIYSGGEALRTQHIVFSPEAGQIPLSQQKTNSSEKSPEAAAAIHDLPLNLEEAKDRLIERALQVADNNISAAARLLGVHRSYLHRWREKQTG